MLSISLLRPVLPASLPSHGCLVFGAAVELGTPESEPRADGLHPRVEAISRESTCQAQTTGDIPPYRLGVNSGAVTTAGMSDLQRAKGREKATYRWIRLLAAAVIAFVVTTSLQGHPAPGGAGQALGVTVGPDRILCRHDRRDVADLARLAIRMAVLLLAVAAAAALVGLQGNDAAFLGVFPAVCMAALALPVHLSVAVAGAAIVAVSAASAADGRAGIVGVVLNDFAILAFYVLSLFARRLRERTSGQNSARRAGADPGRPGEAAALAERQRLAREMHDVLAHSLSGLVLNLEGSQAARGPRRCRPAGQRRDRPCPRAGQDRAGGGPARDRHAAG